VGPKKKRPRLFRAISSALSSIRAHLSPTPPSEPLHVEDQNQPGEGERDASIADTSSLGAEPTEPITNEHAMGHENRSEEGDDASIESHGGNEHASAEHVTMPAGVRARDYQQTGKHDHPPAIYEAQSALDDIKKLLRPPRDKGPGYKDPGLDELLRGRLEGMRHFLWAYVNPQSSTHGAWGASSMKAADDLEKGMAFACKLREWSRAFLADREDIPINPYGKWNESILDRNATLVQDIHLHLQGIGPFVKALDLVDFMDTPDMRA